VSVIQIFNQWNLAFVSYFCIVLAAIYVMAKRERADGHSRPPHYTMWMAIAMAAMALLLGWLCQPQVTLNGGLGFDGIRYASMYERFLVGRSDLPLEFPFDQRLGLPYLAAKIPLSPRPAFFIMHCLFWLPTMAIFALMCRRVAYAPNYLTLLAVLRLQIHWLGIPRAAAHYTFVVESASVFFMTALAYLVFARKPGIVIISFALVGAIFKESIALWCLCLTFGVGLACLRRKEFDKRTIAYLLAACVGAFAVSTACQMVFGAAETSSAVNTLMMWAKLRLFDPLAYLRYASAICNALGGFLVLLFAFYRPTEKNAAHNNKNITAMWATLASYLGVCFFAGSDLTRFAFMSFAISLPVLLHVAKGPLERLPANMVFAVFVLSLPVTHLFSLELSPAPGHELPHQDTAGPYSWMMEYAHPIFVMAWLAWFGLITLLARIYYQLRNGDGNYHTVTSFRWPKSTHGSLRKYLGPAVKREGRSRQSRPVPREP